MKKSMIFAFGVLAILASCQGKQTDKNSVKEEKERVELVKTTVMKMRTIERHYSVSTNLLGYQTVNISPSLQGKIEHIFAEVGDKKNAGDMLVRMDQNQYKSTKLQMNNLETEMGRQKALLASGSVSQQTYDQVKLSYDQVKENLEFLQTNTYVKAPFSGVISAKNYEDGELYAGQPIVVLTQINKLKALIAIPESYFPLVKAGMKVDLRCEIYPGKNFPATIEVVYPTIDAATHTFQCKLQIPNAKELLRPGMYVTTTLGLGRERAFVMPYQAVEKMVGSNERFIFVNENGFARRISVKMGQRFDQDIELISNELNEGMEMVTTGQGKLIDGVKLNVVE